MLLAPGSRSAPFVPVLAEAEERGLLAVRVLLDERSAGFAAVGAGRAALLAGERRPTAVITTSGTAVGNLHPAVLEADAAGVPLLIVSADRPHELVGTGANQTTQQAVMALQKAHGLSRDGVVGPQTWSAVYSPRTPRPRTTSAFEIDKTRQLQIVARWGWAQWVFNTSTGAPSTPTPVGRWRFQRAINGMDRSPLGTLWRPRYFYRGYAIHGSRSIPGYPASHGCARLHNKAIDFIWAHNLAPIGRQIWIY